MFPVIVAKISKLDIRRLVFIFPFIAVLHELEEWNILDWHRKYNSNVPADLINLHLRTMFLIISIMIIVWTVVSLIPKNKKITAYIIFPLLTGSIINGFEHLYWTVRFADYAPGFIFGFVFAVPLIIHIAYKTLNEGLIARWYALVFGAIAATGIIKLFFMGDKIDPLIVSIMKISPAISDLIWK